MPGLSFLSKKSWHTSNISNQEKVWIAEQKAAAEEAKLKELTQQIKLEREQEELQKITGKKSSSTGDRGVDWMYEGHKKGEDEEERKKLEEDAQNEAYLLGKEYVPEGQTKNSGDFAVAASMTGALEKASTVGATIGVGAQSGGVNGGREAEEAVLRIQDEANTTAAAVGSTMNEWNQNFHLRHEDPMFSVMQQKKAKDKDVEKKIKLMQRAGLVVKEITKPIAEKMQHDEQEDKNRERRSRKDDSKKSKKKRKHKHQSHSRRHKKRSRRERSSSPSSDDGYSSYSSSYSSEDSQRDRHRSNRKEGGKKRSSRHHYDDDERHLSSDRRRDRHDDLHHGRKRSQSRERRRRRERSPERRDYDRYERHYKHESSARRRERSRSCSTGREDSRGKRRSRGDDREYQGVDSKSSRRENDRDKYDDKKQPEAVVAPDILKKEGYGLIGTSLSNKGNSNKSSLKPNNGSGGDSLGPDQKLREAKREEMERERQSRFGQGRKRRHRETSEERQIALEEMERNAREREKRWSTLS
jgi:hypothetical protein